MRFHTNEISFAHTFSWYATATQIKAARASQRGRTRDAADMGKTRPPPAPSAKRNNTRCGLFAGNLGAALSPVQRRRPANKTYPPLPFVRFIMEPDIRERAGAEPERPTRSLDLYEYA
ncbi:hypothetical protein EVAR_29209_1 [Eumeta japonica]|uniref:Uncharacterized protein n=1 Tax=Eumeta variegata TaxID=151549 RepID=A0A4C1VH50_EUMVA|nr:hypothetical protein EVAR_29209_1 [Eumeta japonica]